MSSLVKAGRFAARWLACLGSLLVASIADSQWVINQYTGGTATIGGIPWSYTGYQWGYGGASPNGNCGGTIDAEFLWVGDPDAVPTPSVLIQKCYVLSWVSNMGTPISAGSVDNGLSDSVTATSNQSWISPPGIWQYVRSNEAGKNGDGSLITTYQIVENPGEEPVFQCTPSAAIASTGNRNVQVVYSAELVPLEIVFEDSDGIGEAWERRYLIGQQCLATISSPIEVTDHVWEVHESVAPFEDWIADADEAEWFPLTNVEGESLSVRFAKPSGSPPAAAELLFCDVRLVAPTGSKFDGDDSTTVSRELTVDKPTASLSAYIGTVQLTDDGVPANQMQLWGGVWDGDTAGIWIVGSAVDPEGYEEREPSGWNFVQTVTPHRRMYWYGTWKGLNVNGQVDMLDKRYPYTPLPQNGFVFGCNSVPYTALDSPKQPLLSGATVYEILDAFDMHMMYRPPGSETSFVSLRRVGWFWEGDATQSAQVWSLTGTDAAWGFSESFPPHPEWSARLDINSVSWEDE